MSSGFFSRRYVLPVVFAVFKWPTTVESLSPATMISDSSVALDASRGVTQSDISPQITAITYNGNEPLPRDLHYLADI
jgi:hypothetical protein